MAQQMFGSFDPELLKQSIAAEEERNLLAQAQLSPAQMQNLIQLRSGQMLGKGVGQIVGGIFGVEAQDPRLRQAQMAQTAYQEALQATGGDANSPEFFKVFSNSAAAKGLTTLAQQAAVQASTLESEQQQAFQRKASGIASIAQAQRERAGARTTPLDQARTTVLTLGARPPNTLTSAEQAELTAATTLLRLNAPGTVVNVGDKASDVAAGKAIGEATAAIGNKYSALESLKSASDLLDKGIYAGPYAPLEQGLAKYSGGIIGNRQKVINTETFLSEIGNTVIPRLQEFGGNDSVEELKYLKDVQGGRIDLEPKTLKNIIKSAEKKIQAGIERLQLQSKAIETGKPLPLGPVSGEQGRPPKSTKGKTASGVVFEILED